MKSSFFYFIGAMLLVTGLMYFGGYIGHAGSRTFDGDTGMSNLVSGSPSSGGCASCKWY